MPKKEIFANFIHISLKKKKISFPFHPLGCPFLNTQMLFLPQKKNNHRELDLALTFFLKQRDNCQVEVYQKAMAPFPWLVAFTWFLNDNL